MGKLLIIKGSDFSQVAVNTVEPIIGKITIFVEASPSGGGIVTGGGRYEEGDTVQLSAVANTGYQFLRWSDGDTNATRTITVGNASETYTAIFDELGFTTINKTATDHAGVNISTVAEAKTHNSIKAKIIFNTLPDYDAQHPNTKSYSVYTGYGDSETTMHQIVGVNVPLDNIEIGVEYDLGTFSLAALSDIDGSKYFNFSMNYKDDSLGSWEKQQVPKRTLYTLKYKFV